MVAENSGAIGRTDREIVTTRLINAPRELLWEAWTDPKRLAVWWGPRGFTTTTHTMDFRVGGFWRYTMHGPDGTDYPNLIAYREITKPERIVYDHSGEGDFSDIRFHSTVTFETHGAKTKVILRAVFPSKEERDHVIEISGAVEGGKQTLERLDEQAAIMTGPNLEITRLFNAPRELVWKAWTDAERLVQWWGPKGFDLGVAKLDLQPGGMFLYSMKSAGGQEMWGRFIYRDIIPPQRIAYVSSFSDPEGNLTRAPFGGDFTHWPLEVLNHLALTESGGKTKLELRSAPLNATDEERATFVAVQGNVQAGFAATFDQLEAYLTGAQA